MLRIGLPQIGVNLKTVRGKCYYHDKFYGAITRQKLCSAGVQQIWLGDRTTRGRSKAETFAFGRNGKATESGLKLSAEIIVVTRSKVGLLAETETESE